MKERCLIWREDDGEESREAALVRRGDRLCIEEISRGPLTRAMFGASPYGRRIVIEGEFAPAVLAHALYADSKTSRWCSGNSFRWGAAGSLTLRTRLIGRTFRMFTRPTQRTRLPSGLPASPGAISCRYKRTPFRGPC